MYLSETNYSYPTQTLCLKASHYNFLSYFLIFFTNCQHFIIFSDALLSINILISFDHPLSNLKHKNFLSFMYVEFPNVFLSALHLVLLAFFSLLLDTFMFPCFHSTLIDPLVTRQDFFQKFALVSPYQTVIFLRFWWTRIKSDLSNLPSS